MMPESATHTAQNKRSFWFCVIVIALGLTGAVQLAGGAYLIVLGGSPYYAIAGLVLLVSAALIWRRQRRGIELYAVYLLLTLAWAFWEAGTDAWALLPRIGLPLAFGLLLATPSIRRRVPAAPLPRGYALGLALVGVGSSVVVGLALHTLNPRPADPVYQTGMLDTADVGMTPFEGAEDAGSEDWAEFGGNKAGNRFSALDQLTPDNVSGLKPVWTHRIGIPDGAKNFPPLEATPLMVNGSLYLCSGTGDIIALDPETGTEIWRFNAKTDLTMVSFVACRGVVYYDAGGQAGDCPQRIVVNTVDARLLAVDAHTGLPCTGFGDDGVVSLLTGMGDVPKGYYAVTSAPTIVRGRIVLGSWVRDNQYWGEPSGVIRAFDAVTGAFAWAFDVGRLDRQSEPPEGETYTHSTPNAWGPMSADETLGLVFAPTGNATPDYFGAQRRPFDEEFSSAVIAIEAETGKLRWSFQTTHHDVWDYDVGAQPVLVDLDVNGETRQALVQPTKRGEIFVLDRTNGEPLFPVEERPVPQNGKVPEERLAPTQPYSPGLPSFRGADLTEADMWGVSPFDQLWCRIHFKESRYVGPMTPPGLTRSIAFPNTFGGINWGSVSIDRDRNLMIVNASRIAGYMRLIPRAEADAMGLKPRTKGHKVYRGGMVPQQGLPYAADVMTFMSPIRIPCSPPPFGRLAGVDLSSGKLLWVRSLGTAPNAGPLPLASLPLTLGSPFVGGSITTRGGLTFIGATVDRMFRAIDTMTGRTLWRARLPATAFATPMTYLSPKSGRQFVVIAAGGRDELYAAKGDYILAFALPKEGDGAEQ